MKHELAMAFGALVLARPIGLIALILPLIVWMWVRSASRSRPIATGTLAIWRAVLARVPRTGAVRRARPSPAVWCVLASLVLGALALSGPRFSTPPAARAWRLYVDRRPAMYLRDQGSTRMERALDAAQHWLDTSTRPGDEVTWIAPGSASALGENESARGPRAPGEWSVAPRIPRSAPDWLACDHPGAVWITDRAPAMVPRHAVLVLSGGAAVPGPIDASGTTRWDWDGQRVVEVPHGVAERYVAIEGELAEPLADVVRAWASARGLALGANARSDVALRIRTSSTGDARDVVAGRDGWRASGRIIGAAPAVDEDGVLETWLAAPARAETRVPIGAETRALMTRGAGRVWSAWSRMDDPEGDPAAFAVSLATLFDACVLPADGVVDLADRLAAGSAEIRAPRASSAGANPGERELAVIDSARRLDPWLALAALLAALAAFAIVLVPRHQVNRDGGRRPRTSRAGSIDRVNQGA